MRIKDINILMKLSTSRFYNSVANFLFSCALIGQAVFFVTINERYQSSYPNLKPYLNAEHFDLLSKNKDILNLLNCSLFVIAGVFGILTFRRLSGFFAIIASLCLIATYSNPFTFPLEYIRPLPEHMTDKQGVMYYGSIYCLKALSMIGVGLYQMRSSCDDKRPKQLVAN
jgi:hypothetical protein